MFDLKERCYKVAEITQLIKSSLESEFTNIALEGEISNFRPSSTGHFYFTLKDQEAMIQAVMFKNRLGGLKFKPSDGQLVKVHGSISVYAKRGSYQIICESMEIAGQGDILLKLEQLKNKLAEEGLFDNRRKKALPLLPARVGIITSPTGAALRDILRVLKRRNAGINLIIFPTVVQGDDAAEKIAKQIETANITALCEVLILGRGGGSLEDLLPFSDERVVRAVAASRIPVISAVGHEVDITLSDLAADVRAPTPSAAAEIVAASQEEIRLRVTELKEQIIRILDQKLERMRLLFQHFSPENLERNFRMIIQPSILRLDDAKETLIYLFKDMLKENHHKAELLQRELESNSPLNILRRGYAVVTDTQTKAIITQAQKCHPQQDIAIQLAKGRLRAKVGEINP